MDDDFSFCKVKYNLDFYKILLVENVFCIAKNMVKVLKDNGYFVVHGSDGKGALNLYTNYLPDIVIIPDRLPDMTGLDLVGRLRTLSGMDRMFILYITPQNDYGHLKELKTIGVNSYILKPFEAPDLLLTLRELVVSGGNLSGGES